MVTVIINVLFIIDTSQRLRQESQLDCKYYLFELINKPIITYDF